MKGSGNSAFLQKDQLRYLKRAEKQQFSMSRTWTLFTVCKDFLYGIAFEQCVERSGSDRKKRGIDTEFKAFTV